MSKDKKDGVVEEKKKEEAGERESWTVTVMECTTTITGWASSEQGEGPTSLTHSPLTFETHSKTSPLSHSPLLTLTSPTKPLPLPTPALTKWRHLRQVSEERDRGREGAPD
ncbi:uncharacterized protein DS421_11g338350 [Arachis hypogaea]|nr:uncharacterized protein DS421_11g338350 [Arachis hypogaea]